MINLEMPPRDCVNISPVVWNPFPDSGQQSEGCQKICPKLLMWRIKKQSLRQQTLKYDSWVFPSPNLHVSLILNFIALNNGIYLYLEIAAFASPKKNAAVGTKQTVDPNPFQDGLDPALTCTGGLRTDIALGMGSPDGVFANLSTIFSLRDIVDFHTVWNGVPALHSTLMSVTDMFTRVFLGNIVGCHTKWSIVLDLRSPHMSVTNTISGITAVSGLLLKISSLSSTSMKTSLWLIVALWTWMMGPIRAWYHYWLSQDGATVMLLVQQVN